MTQPAAPSTSGETRTRLRERRQFLFIGLGGLVGGIVGGVTAIASTTGGNLFQGEWDKLTLDPALSIALAGLLIFGFLALPLWGFRMVDEFKREFSLIGFTGGCLAVLAGFPVWAVLHVGGFVPAPHPFGIWLIAFIAMLVAYAIARWRG